MSKRKQNSTHSMAYSALTLKALTECHLKKCHDASLQILSAPQPDKLNVICSFSCAAQDFFLFFFNITFGLAIAKTNFSALFFPTPGSLGWLVTTMKSSRQPPKVMTDWYGWESSVFCKEPVTRIQTAESEPKLQKTTLWGFFGHEHIFTHFVVLCCSQDSSNKDIKLKTVTCKEQFDDKTWCTRDNLDFMSLVWFSKGGTLSPTISAR